MEDAPPPPQFAQRVTQDEYDRQAVDYTTAMVEQLNAAVRAQPSLGEMSAFFQDPENVQKGLPVFQGKHTRFVYDSDDEEIVAAVDVTHTPLPGPHVRTVADLDPDEDEDDEDEEYDEDDEEEAMDEDEDDDMGVENAFYVNPDTPDDSTIGALLEDVAMELAAFDMADGAAHP
jgi:hypothetical protein